MQSCVQIKYSKPINQKRLGFSLEWMTGVKPTGFKRPKLKCPKCGRKITASIYPDHDGTFVIFFIPPHKPRYWWKK